MIACLPMYFRKEVEAAHQAYWQAIRHEMLVRSIACPEQLSHADDLMQLWRSPELFLSQTCGLPYRLTLHGQVNIVGTPDYGVHGCEPGYYCSALIVRNDDARRSIEEYSNAVFAYNQTDSQSGYAAAYSYCKARDFWFTNLVETGAHELSARAVISGKADIAAIDAVTWHLLCETVPDMKKLRVLERTAPTPGLPYISAMDNEVDLMYEAIVAAIKSLPGSISDQLQLKGFVKISSAAYLSVSDPG